MFGIDAIGALGIFDRKGAVAMVASSASLGYDRAGSSRAQVRPQPPRRSARKT